MWYSSKRLWFDASAKSFKSNLFLGHVLASNETPEALHQERNMSALSSSEDELPTVTNTRRQLKDYVARINGSTAFIPFIEVRPWKHRKTHRRITSSEHSSSQMGRGGLWSTVQIIPSQLSFFCFPAAWSHLRTHHYYANVVIYKSNPPRCP